MGTIAERFQGQNCEHVILWESLPSLWLSWCCGIWQELHICLDLRDWCGIRDRQCHGLRMMVSVRVTAELQIVIFSLPPLWASGWANTIGIPTKYKLYLYYPLIQTSPSAYSAQPPWGTSCWLTYSNSEDKGDHWAAIILDFEYSADWYGDSFRQRPVEEVTLVLASHHTGVKFVYQRLKISPQKDGYSCSLLGTNMLFQFYVPDAYPLFDVVSKRYARKKSSTQGQIFQLRPPDPPLLYVVRDSHALGGKFPHLVVCFWILEFSL